MPSDVRFRAVFFDFGGTLFSYHRFRERFDRLLVDTARRHGVEAPADELRQTYITAILPVMREYVTRPFYYHRDMFGDLGAAYLRALGADPDPESRARFYTGQTEVASPLIEAREGAVETLQGLRAAGLHIGVVSNIDNDQFEVLWERCGLAPLVDAVTTSEDARSCKPDSAIYRAALDKADGPSPQEVIFVGDSLHQDVAGANPLGMSSVLIGSEPPEPDGPIQPTHVISDLRELLDIVRG